MNAVERRAGPAIALPNDAVLVELRSDGLEFETRQCVLPGTLVALLLVMEGNPLRVELPTNQCLVVEKDRIGYVYRSRIGFEELSEADRHLIGLYIAKGRGSPQLTRP